ncbi:hypothetical protein TSAR_001825 [Trichomalopsis sarcophagae]|uniref:Uncharacterized protein n=1 Tax=Trichomalopsis sarcophagae TaxID=543379 RepID=A0A232F4Q9_9HYME|nr:hypothetical protein TSAR_001825 [Trichomalopsis sarcophagae]
MKPLSAALNVDGRYQNYRVENPELIFKKTQITEFPKIRFQSRATVNETSLRYEIVKRNFEQLSTLDFSSLPGGGFQLAPRPEFQNALEFKSSEIRSLRPRIFPLNFEFNIKQ